MNNISQTLKVVGILLIAGSVQSLSFYGYVTPKIEEATTNLSLLQAEVPGNHLLDTTLDVLRDYRRISDDEVTRRQVLQLRQDFIQRFRDDSRLAIEEFDRVARTFEAQSNVGQELLDTLRRNLSHLNEMYSDHFAIAVDSYDSPSWYFQPAAALVTISPEGRQKLDFNHALYLALVGQRGPANAIYNELRLNSNSDQFKSKILFAQSRLQYDAFRVEQDPEYLRQAVHHAQQSLAHDAAYDLPKLFLEYLLAIDLKAVDVEGIPMEEQGSGESQGERGAISTEAPEH
jgi:hypothetical protein